MADPGSNPIASAKSKNMLSKSPEKPYKLQCFPAAAAKSLFQVGESVPFSGEFKQQPLVQFTLRTRRNRIAAYGIAVALVAGATLARWSVNGQLVDGLPFITFYPAIVLGTLFGGFWPGVLALALSAAAAWWLFLLGAFSFHVDMLAASSLLLFIFVGGVNVCLVAMLNSAVENILMHGQNVRVLIESAPSGIMVVDERGIIKLVNRSIEIQFGYDRHELLGQSIEVLVPTHQATTHRAIRGAFLRQPEARSMGADRELCGKRKDGSEFPVEIGLNPISVNGGTAVLATVIDISERKREQDRREFLIRELRHRSKNLFAVIQAIAAKSLAGVKTLPEARDVFTGRLMAVSRAHEMLASSEWEGASLMEIIERESSAVSRQLSVNGCDITLDTPAAQQFSLVIHELATNAVKYGALSSCDGHVSIECRVEREGEEETLCFRWTESGGPKVVAPKRKGFGSVILLDAMEGFAKDLMLRYDSDGLRYELRCPLSAIAAGNKRDGLTE